VSRWTRSPDREPSSPISWQRSAPFSSAIGILQGDGALKMVNVIQSAAAAWGALKNSALLRSTNAKGMQARSILARDRCNAVLPHGSLRSVRESYGLSRLRFQGLSLAVGVLALACELRYAFCIAADFATEFFSLDGDAVTSWMGAFRGCVHRISFDRWWVLLKPHEAIATDSDLIADNEADNCRLRRRTMNYGFGVATAVTWTGRPGSDADELTAGAGLSAGISVPAG
jgi:hypothetical protein